MTPRHVDRAGEPADRRVPIRFVDVERRPLAEYGPPERRCLVKQPSRRERIAAQLALADLKMPGALEALDEVVRGVDGGGTSNSPASDVTLCPALTRSTIRRLRPGRHRPLFPAMAHFLGCRQWKSVRHSGATPVTEGSCGSPAQGGARLSKNRSMKAVVCGRSFRP